MQINFGKSKIFIFIFLLSLFAHQTNAQNKVDIFGLAGYQLNTNITVAEGELKFQDAFTYSFGVDVPVDRMMSAEISWSNSASKISLDHHLGTTIELTDVSINHFQAGALIEPEKGGKVSPFGLLTMGATLFHPAKDQLEDVWRFCISLGLGAKVNLSEKLGFRFQSRLLLPMQFSGSTVWVGGGGAGVSVGSYTAFAEFDFTGGLYFRL